MDTHHSSSPHSVPSPANAIPTRHDSVGLHPLSQILPSLGRYSVHHRLAANIDLQPLMTVVSTRWPGTSVSAPPLSIQAALVRPVVPIPSWRWTQGAIWDTAVFNSKGKPIFDWNIEKLHKTQLGLVFFSGSIKFHHSKRIISWVYCLLWLTLVSQ